MNCLLCRQKIPLRRRLSGDSFCCDEHRRQHSAEQSDQGLKRLLEQPAPAKLVQMPSVRKPSLDLALAYFAEEIPPEAAVGLSAIAGSLRWKNCLQRPILGPPLALAGAFVRPPSLAIDVAVANCFGAITWGMANRCIWPMKSLRFPSHQAVVRSGLLIAVRPVESTLEPVSGAEGALDSGVGDWLEIVAARPRLSLRRPSLEKSPLEISPVIPAMEPQLSGFLNGYFTSPRPDFAAWSSPDTEPAFKLPQAILALRAKDPDFAPVKDWQDAITDAIPVQPAPPTTDGEVWEALDEPLCEAPSPWGGNTPGTALIACAVDSAPWVLPVPDGVSIPSTILQEPASPRMAVRAGVFASSSATGPRAASPELATAHFEPVSMVPIAIDPGSPRSIIEGTGIEFAGLAEGNGGTAVRMTDDRSKGSRPAEDSVMQLLAPRRRSVFSRLFGGLRFGGVRRGGGFSSRGPRRRWGLVAATVLAAAIPAGIFAIVSGSGGGFRLESLQAAISARATVELEDDFRNGLGAWEGEGSATSSWTFDHTGFAIPGRLALYQASTSLVDYRVEFLAMIDKKALGMVYRAADMQNYYAMRINIVEAGPLPKAKIERYAVIDGKVDGRSELPLSLPLRSEMMYRVLVNVAGDRFTVSVNGQVVDTWSDSRLAKGGVGFFGGKGDVARLRWVRIVDRDDFLGRVCARLSPRADDWKTRTEQALRRTLAQSKSQVVGADR